VHGYYDLRIQFLHDFPCRSGINGKNITNRDKKNINGLQLLCQLIIYDMTQVAQMTEINSVYLEMEDIIKSPLLTVHVVMACANRPDRNTSDHRRFSALPDDFGVRPFNRSGAVVVEMVVADKDNIGSYYRRFDADGFTIMRIGDQRDALVRYLKTRMSVPSDVQKKLPRATA
jgi:hypothetical protein